jgi:HK97 family phage major capsid protein
MTIEELKARLAELQEQATAIQATADAAKRDLTAEEEAQLEANFAEFEKVEKDIKTRERLAANGAKINAPAPRKAAPNVVASDDPLEASDIRAARSTPAERGRWGWKNFGDFAYAVKNAVLGKGPDDRLMNAALSTYGNEGVGADGGFAVPPEFRTAIMQKVSGEDSLLSLSDQLTTGGYSITVPKDETTPWGTAGIQAFWDGEAATMTQRKPALENTTIRLHKLTALVPVTDELLEDAPALGSYVQSRAPTVIDFKVSDSIVNGSGAGMPLGILNSSCLVTQAAEGSQTADTLHGLNIVKMWARMPVAWRANAVWLIHPDNESQLMTVGLQVGSPAGTMTGGSLLYMPPGGLSGAPYGTLLGKRVIPTQVCSAIGDVGDIIFASMGQYAALQKAGGLKSDSSIHLWFDQGVTAFRFTFRMGGQPWWSSTIAAKSGSGTYSPFITLAAR